MITKFERKVIAGLTAFLMCLSMVLAVPVVILICSGFSSSFLCVQA